MNPKKALLALLIFILFAAASGRVLAQEQPQSPAGGSLPPANLAGWKHTALDAPTDQSVGKYASIALDPLNDNPYIAYFDETNGDLKLAYPVSANGNCGPENAWKCEIVAGNGTVSGRHTSVAVYATLVTRRVGIAYVETVGQNQVLKYATYYCTILHPCGTWQYETVFTLSGVQPMYTSLKFDSTAEPHIAFYTPGYKSPLPAANGALRYASHTTPGGTGWLTSLVAQGFTPPGGHTGDNTLGIGLYPSLALNSSDHPRIAFFGADYGNLLYAVYVGNNTGSCYSDDWDCQLVDDNVSNTGMFPSLYLTNIYSQANMPEGGGDQAYIAYYEQGDGYIRYATNTELGGCGSNTQWYCTHIDEVGKISLTTSADYYSRHVGVSLALDAAGLPLIAYQMVNMPGADGLKVGRPANAVGKSTANCGPMGFWECTWIHVARDGNIIEGNYASLAVNSEGMATIAYSEDESWFGDGWHLRLAYQQFMVYLPLVVK
jgi:hypothetical protein